MYIGDRSDSPSPAVVSSEFPDVSLSGDGAAASSSGVKILQAKRLAAAQQKKKQLTGVKKSKCSAQVGCMDIWVVIFLHWTLYGEYQWRMLDQSFFSVVAIICVKNRSFVIQWYA